MDSMGGAKLKDGFSAEGALSEQIGTSPKQKEQERTWKGTFAIFDAS